LAKALGDRGQFGGDVARARLADLPLHDGMERFDSDKGELYTHASFRAAVKIVQDNLAPGVNQTHKVYEVILPEQKLVVFGVAMNDPQHGEGWWVKQAGTENIAALPWKIYIVNGTVYALYAG